MCDCGVNADRRWKLAGSGVAECVGQSSDENCEHAVAQYISVPGALINDGVGNDQ